jgi:hypothetical protein
MKTPDIPDFWQESTEKFNLLTTDLDTALRVASERIARIQWAETLLEGLATCEAFCVAHPVAMNAFFDTNLPVNTLS